MVDNPPSDGKPGKSSSAASNTPGGSPDAQAVADFQLAMARTYAAMQQEYSSNVELCNKSNDRDHIIATMMPTYRRLMDINARIEYNPMKREHVPSLEYTGFLYSLGYRPVSSNEAIAGLLRTGGCTVTVTRDEYQNACLDINFGKPIKTPSNKMRFVRMWIRRDAAAVYGFEELCEMFGATEAKPGIARDKRESVYRVIEEGNFLVGGLDLSLHEEDIEYYHTIIRSAVLNIGDPISKQYLYGYDRFKGEIVSAVAEPAPARRKVEARTRRGIGRAWASAISFLQEKGTGLARGVAAIIPHKTISPEQAEYDQGAKALIDSTIEAIRKKILSKESGTAIRVGNCGLGEVEGRFYPHYHSHRVVRDIDMVPLMPHADVAVFLEEAGIKSVEVRMGPDGAGPPALWVEPNEPLPLSKEDNPSNMNGYFCFVVDPANPDDVIRDEAQLGRLADYSVYSKQPLAKSRTDEEWRQWRSAEIVNMARNNQLLISGVHLFPDLETTLAFINSLPISDDEKAQFRHAMRGYYDPNSYYNAEYVWQTLEAGSYLSSISLHTRGSQKIDFFADPNDTFNALEEFGCVPLLTRQAMAYTLQRDRIKKIAPVAKDGKTPACLRVDFNDDCSPGIIGTLRTHAFIFFRDQETGNICDDLPAYHRDWNRVLADILTGEAVITLGFAIRDLDKLKKIGLQDATSYQRAQFAQAEYRKIFPSPLQSRFDIFEDLERPEVELTLKRKDLEAFIAWINKRAKFGIGRRFNLTRERTPEYRLTLYDHENKPVILNIHTAYDRARLCSWMAPGIRPGEYTAALRMSDPQGQVAEALIFERASIQRLVEEDYQAVAANLDADSEIMLLSLDALYKRYRSQLRRSSKTGPTGNDIVEGYVSLFRSETKDMFLHEDLPDQAEEAIRRVGEELLCQAGADLRRNLALFHARASIIANQALSENGMIRLRGYLDEANYLSIKNEDGIAIDLREIHLDDEKREALEQERSFVERMAEASADYMVDRGNEDLYTAQMDRLEAIAPIFGGDQELLGHCPVIGLLVEYDGEEPLVSDEDFRRFIELWQDRRAEWLLGIRGALNHNYCQGDEGRFYAWANGASLTIITDDLQRYPFVADMQTRLYDMAGFRVAASCDVDAARSVLERLNESNGNLREPISQIRTRLNGFLRQRGDLAEIAENEPFLRAYGGVLLFTIREELTEIADSLTREIEEVQLILVLEINRMLEELQPRVKAGREGRQWFTRGRRLDAQARKKVDKDLAAIRKAQPDQVRGNDRTRGIGKKMYDMLLAKSKALLTTRDIITGILEGSDQWLAEGIQREAIEQALSDISPSTAQALTEAARRQEAVRISVEFGDLATRPSVIEASLTEAYAQDWDDARLRACLEAASELARQIDSVKVDYAQAVLDSDVPAINAVTARVGTINRFSEERGDQLGAVVLVFTEEIEKDLITAFRAHREMEDSLIAELAKGLGDSQIVINALPVGGNSTGVASQRLAEIEQALHWTPDVIERALEALFPEKPASELPPVSGMGMVGALKEGLLEQLDQVRRARSRAPDLLASIARAESVEDLVTLDGRARQLAEEMFFDTEKVMKDLGVRKSTSSATANINSVFLDQAHRALYIRLKQLVADQLKKAEDSILCDDMASELTGHLSAMSDCKEKAAFQSEVQRMIDERTAEIVKDKEAYHSLEERVNKFKADVNDLVRYESGVLDKDKSTIEEISALMKEGEILKSEIEKGTLPTLFGGLLSAYKQHAEPLAQEYRNVSKAVQERTSSVELAISGEEETIEHSDQTGVIEQALDRLGRLPDRIENIRSSESQRSLTAKLNAAIRNAEERISSLTDDLTRQIEALKAIHREIHEALNRCQEQEAPDDEPYINVDAEELQDLEHRAEAKEAVVDRIEDRTERRGLRATHRDYLATLRLLLDEIKADLDVKIPDTAVALNVIKRAAENQRMFDGKPLLLEGFGDLRKSLSAQEELFEEGKTPIYIRSSNLREQLREKARGTGREVDQAEAAIREKVEEENGQIISTLKSIEERLAKSSSSGHPDVVDIEVIEGLSEELKGLDPSITIENIPSADALEQIKQDRIALNIRIEEERQKVTLLISETKEKAETAISGLRDKIAAIRVIEDTPDTDQAETRIGALIKIIPSSTERENLSGGLTEEVSHVGVIKQELESEIQQRAETVTEAIKSLEQAIPAEDTLGDTEALEAFKSLETRVESIRVSISEIPSSSARAEDSALSAELARVSRVIDERKEIAQKAQEEEDAIRTAITDLSAKVRGFVMAQDGSGFQAACEEPAVLGRRIKALSINRQDALAEDAKRLVDRIAVATDALGITRKIRAAESQMGRTDQDGELASLASTLSNLESEIAALEDDEIRSDVDGIYKSALEALNGKRFSATRDEAVAGLRRQADSHIRMLSGWNVDRGRDGLVDRAIGESKTIETLLTEMKMVKDMEAWLGILSSAPAEDKEAEELLAQYRERFEKAKAAKMAHAEVALRLAKADKEVAAAWQDPDALDQIERRLLESNPPKAVWEILPYGAQQGLSRREEGLIRKIRNRKRDLGRPNGGAPAPGTEPARGERAPDTRHGRLQRMPRGRQHGQASAEGVFSVLDSLGLPEAPVDFEPDEPTHEARGPKTAGASMSTEEMLAELRASPDNAKVYSQLKPRVERQAKKGNFRNVDTMLKSARKIAEGDASMWQGYARKAEAAEEHREKKASKRGGKSSSAGFKKTLKSIAGLPRTIIGLPKWAKWTIGITGSLYLTAVIIWPITVLAATGITASLVALAIYSILDDRFEEKWADEKEHAPGEAPVLFDEDGNIDPFSGVLEVAPVFALLRLDTAFPVAKLPAIMPAIKTNPWILTSVISISLLLVVLIVNGVRISRLKRAAIEAKRKTDTERTALTKALDKREENLVDTIVHYINSHNIHTARLFLEQDLRIQQLIFYNDRLHERAKRWLEACILYEPEVAEGGLDLHVSAETVKLKHKLLKEDKKSNSVEEEFSGDFQIMIKGQKGKNPYIIIISPGDQPTLSVVVEIGNSGEYELLLDPQPIAYGKEYYIGKNPEAEVRQEDVLEALDRSQFIYLGDETEEQISPLHCTVCISKETEDGDTQMWAKVENRSEHGTYIEYMKAIRRRFEGLVVKKSKRQTKEKRVAAAASVPDVAGQTSVTGGKKKTLIVPSGGLKTAAGRLQANPDKKRRKRRGRKDKGPGKSSSAGIVIPVVLLGVAGAIIAGVVFVVRRIRRGKRPDEAAGEFIMHDSGVRVSLDRMPGYFKSNPADAKDLFFKATALQQNSLLDRLPRSIVNYIAGFNRTVEAVAVTTEKHISQRRSDPERVTGEITINVGEAGDNNFKIRIAPHADRKTKKYPVSFEAYKGETLQDSCPMKEGMPYVVSSLQDDVGDKIVLAEDGDDKVYLVPVSCQNDILFFVRIWQEEGEVWFDLTDQGSSHGVYFQYERVTGYRMENKSAPPTVEPKPTGSAVTSEAGKRIRQGGTLSLGKAVPPPVKQAPNIRTKGSKSPPTKSSSPGNLKLGAAFKELSGELTAIKASSPGKPEEKPEILIDEHFEGERPLGHKPTDFEYTVNAVTLQEKGMNLRYMADRIVEQAKARPEKEIRVALSRHYWTDRDNGLQETLQELVDEQLADSDKKVEVVLSGIGRQGTAIGVVAHSRFVLNNETPGRYAIGIYVSDTDIKVGVVDQETMEIRGSATKFDLKPERTLFEQIKYAIRLAGVDDIDSISIAISDTDLEGTFGQMEAGLKEYYREPPISIFNCNRAQALSSAEIISGTGYGFNMIFRVGLEEQNATLSVVENAAITSFNAISDDTVVTADGWVARRVYDGHINETYELTNKETREKFIIQNLNTIFDIDAEDNNLPLFEISQDNSLKRGILPPDWEKAEYLNVKGAEPASKIYYDANGNAWRVMKYIKGKIFQVFDDVPDADKEDVARELGRAAALFPMICAQAPEGSKWADPLPGFHNADYHYYDYFLELLRNKRIPKSLSRDGKEMVQIDPEIMKRYADQIDPLIEDIKIRKALVDCLKEAGKGITHADLKLNNLVFKRDENGRLRLIGFIDLDTIRPGNKMDDIGDILRYAGPVAGESPRNEDGEYDVSKVVLDNNVVADIAVGYLRGVEEFYGPDEARRLKPLVLKAFEQYLWVQAIRFFADGLVGNKYFHLKPGEPKDFNIFRGAVQMQGLKLLERETENILRLIDEKLQAIDQATSAAPIPVGEAKDIRVLIDAAA